MNIRFDGAAALVTGAGVGIGRGIAMTLAAAGATVIVNDKDAQTGRQTAADIQAQGGRSLFVQADVSDEGAVAAMVDHIAQEFSALRILVNNAGFGMFKGIQDTTLADWQAILGVDLTGIYLVTRAALPLLKTAGDASVINIASVHAQMTVADITAYAAAKGGVVAMGRSLCQELGPFGIRVNTISPGFIDTPLLQRWLESEPDRVASLQRVLGYHPTGRIGTPDDIGALVAFLSSEHAQFINGANVTVDGGLTARLMH